MYQSMSPENERAIVIVPQIVLAHSTTVLVSTALVAFHMIVRRVMCNSCRLNFFPTHMSEYSNHCQCTLGVLQHPGHLRPHLCYTRSHLPPLCKRANNMRQCIILSLSNTRLQIHLVPFTSLQQPLVRRSADIATTEEVRPDEIDDA